MEYCFHVWADVPSCYMELLDKLHKRIWRTLGPLLAASLELLAHYWNAANFSIGITLIEVFQNWHNWFQFVFLERGLLLILIDCTIFLSPFLDATRMSMSRVSFCAKLDCLPINSLPKECFPLTYNLTLSLELTTINFRFFLKRFPACFNLFVLLFVITQCFLVAFQSCMEWIPI